ncbi:hypothetical protein KJ652_06595 [Patescibacteria group bacterium]|nr:hypothetical protein [Patescibacteria group bacterium]MBU1124220.1 hypothetical protein [Patescibacteria group bacterium]MBU1911213.1 hypothetical protein [Patescibacteria group bacterium]
MKIVIVDSIRKKEFKHGYIASEDLDTIISSFTKGIFTPIKGASLPKESQLIKLYATSVGGAKRIVFLVDMKTKDGYILFYRGKNDAIGKNISIKNPAFKKKLIRYLELLDSDMEKGSYTIYSDQRKS